MYDRFYFRVHNMNDKNPNNNRLTFVFFFAKNSFAKTNDNQIFSQQRTTIDCDFNVLFLIPIGTRTSFCSHSTSPVYIHFVDLSTRIGITLLNQSVRRYYLCSSFFLWYFRCFCENCMPSTYKIMTLVKWAILPLTIFTIFVVMYGHAEEEPSKKGPKVTDIVS